MEPVELGENSRQDNVKDIENESNTINNLSDAGSKLVTLIVKIVVNTTIRACYEEGDKIP